MVLGQRGPTLEELCEQVAELQRRVKFLEVLFKPGGFRQHCLDLDLDCSDIVREWFKYHELVHSKTLAVEMKGYWSGDAIRMAIHRLSSSGELVRVATGVYRLDRTFVRPPSIPTKKVDPEILEQIRQDTTHSHGELARLLGLKVHVVRRAGHKSPYKFSGVQHVNQRGDTNRTLSSQQEMAT